MQIISGKYKGKKLSNCKDRSIRPAMGLVRKSIFDSLGNFIEGVNVLDLCAGTGALGIEALSRGAESLTVVDSGKNAIQIIRKNLTLCGAEARVIRGELPQALSRIPTNEEFELIFLDPPYGQKGFIEKTLSIINERKFLKDDGLIILETELRNDFDVPEDYVICKEKRFGNTKVTYLNGNR